MEQANQQNGTANGSAQQPPAAVSNEPSARVLITLLDEMRPKDAGKSTTKETLLEAAADQVSKADVVQRLGPTTSYAGTKAWPDNRRLRHCTGCTRRRHCGPYRWPCGCRTCLYRCPCGRRTCRCWYKGLVRQQQSQTLGGVQAWTLLYIVF